VNPFLSNEVAGERIRDLRDEAGRTNRRHARPAPKGSGQVIDVTVRPFGEGDIDGIRRLAALDDKPVPIGAVLVAEIEGELVAALPLEGGHALADPFKPTADVVNVLRLRARQVKRESRRGRRSSRSLWMRGHAPARNLA
jgi:hypothetical protein